jgi:dihydroorotate dehydrogenase
MFLAWLEFVELFMVAILTFPHRQTTSAVEKLKKTCPVGCTKWPNAGSIAYNSFRLTITAIAIPARSIAEIDHYEVNFSPPNSTGVSTDM